VFFKLIKVHLLVSELYFPLFVYNLLYDLFRPGSVIIREMIYTQHRKLHLNCIKGGLIKTPIVQKWCFINYHSGIIIISFIVITYYVGVFSPNYQLNFLCISFMKSKSEIWTTFRLSRDYLIEPRMNMFVSL